VADSLGAVLARHPEAEVRAALPLLILAIVQADPKAELPPALVDVVTQFVGGLGLPADADEAAVVSAIQAYAAAHPVPPALKTDLAHALRDVVLTGGQPKDLDALAAVTGAPKTGRPAPAERPAGTVPAGPMARFLVDKK
jgi:hypothetical protein